MYTPDMSVMSLLLKKRYDSKWNRDFFYGKRKMLLSYFSFPKRNFWPFGCLWTEGDLLEEDIVLWRTDTYSGVVKGCFLSFLISFFFISKAALYQRHLLVSLYSSSFSWVICNWKLLGFLVTQSVHFRYSRSSLRSNILVIIVSAFKRDIVRTTDFITVK